MPDIGACSKKFKLKKLKYLEIVPRGYLTIKLEQIVHLAEPQAVNDYLTPNVEEIAV